MDYQSALHLVLAFVAFAIAIISLWYTVNTPKEIRELIERHHRSLQEKHEQQVDYILQQLISNYSRESERVDLLVQELLQRLRGD